MEDPVVHETRKHRPVASYRHALVFLGIAAGVMIAGFAAQNRHVAGGGLVESHANVIPIYASVTVLNWLLALFVWKGVRKQGVSPGSLIGGRWGNAREILRDLGIAALFWGAFVAAGWSMNELLGHGNEKSVDVLLPRTLLEIVAWIAVVVQGLVFGMMHAYQGSRAVVTISILGMATGRLG